MITSMSGWIRRNRSAGEVGRIGADKMQLRPLTAGLWILVATAAIAATIWLTTGWLLAATGDVMARDQNTTSSERAQVRVEIVRTGLAAGAGVGAAVGLMLAFRRQRHQETGTALNNHDATERRITELYAAAAEQLDSDKAPVRLTALYTLERLANSNSAHQQTIVNIICAYLRMPWTPPPDADGQAHRRSSQRRVVGGHPNRLRQSGPLDRPSTDPQEERQVRLVAQKILTDHLEREGSARFWADLDLDLTGAVLVGFDLQSCTVKNAVFRDAIFQDHAGFSGLQCTGSAVFERAQFLAGASFNQADFGDGAAAQRSMVQHLKGESPMSGQGRGAADFSLTVFTDGADFRRARFVEGSNFKGARFSHVDFGEVTFDGPTVLTDTRIADPQGTRWKWPPPTYLAIWLEDAASGRW